MSRKCIDGCSCGKHRPLTDAQRKARSAATRAAKERGAYKDNGWPKGKPKSPEAVEKMRQAGLRQAAHPDFDRDFLARYTKENGPPRKGVKASEETRKRYSERQMALWRDPDYREKQMVALNKVLKSEEWRESCRGREPRGSGYGKQGIREDLGHNARSTWEANYARYLKHIGVQYEFEPEKFIVTIDGVRSSYTPDFRLEDGTYVEVKGYWFPVQKQKYEAFVEQHPDLQLRLVMSSDYKDLQSKYADIIPQWEKS